MFVFFAWSASASSSSKASTLSKALPDPGSSLNEGKTLCKCSFAYGNNICKQCEQVIQELQVNMTL
jgi:hypothetical protein